MPTGPLLLLPRLDRLSAALPASTVWRWLGRADRHADATGSARSAAGTAFDVIPAEFAHAAVARHGEVGDAALNVWLRADPCWLQPDMSSLRMMACGDLQLTSRDAEDLAGAVRSLFGDEGLELSMPHPERWYLKLPMGSEAVRFSPPEDVLGDDVAAHLPSGNSGLRWQRILNEVQMRLHQHPVNRRREAAGLAPVNSLWFWGAGRLPNRVRGARARCFSDDPVLRGLARQAASSSVALPARYDELEDGGDCTLDLRTIAPGELDRHWLQPIVHRVLDRGVGDATFAFAGGERFGLRRAHRWRFWRGPLTPPAQVSARPA
jgi:hypothetical protein